MAEIVERQAVAGLAARLRKDGKTIVTMNGSFDILHVGHIRCLEEASGLGDVLIVAVNSDLSVQSYKGRERPVVPQEERAEMLAALSCVDYIVIFGEPNPKAVLGEIRPDIHCNGADWGPGCVEREVVERNGGKLHILSWSPGRSTSELMKRIQCAPSSRRAVVLRKKLLQSSLSGNVSSLLTDIVAGGMKILVYADENDCGRLEPMEPEIEKAFICQAIDESILNAMRDGFDLALGSCWIISDRVEDICVGRELNLKTAFVGPPPAGPLKPHLSGITLEEVLAAAFRD